jgi:hypothetical protein
MLAKRETRAAGQTFFLMDLSATSHPAQHFRCNTNNSQVLLHGLQNGWSSSAAGLKSSWRSG